MNADIACVETSNLHSSETYVIIGVCMEIHKALGHGFLEAVYKDAIEVELIERGIPFSREEKFDVTYKGVTLRHKYFADFVINNSIILELKAQEGGLIKANQRQIINYLKVSGCRVGLIINFGRDSLEYKRLVL